MSSMIELYTFNGVPDARARSVTTTLSAAVFSDGAVLSGFWTAHYDDAGNLLDQVGADFTVSGPAGTARFAAAGTQPHANRCTGHSYAIQAQARTGSGYDWLTIDWQGENPSTLCRDGASLNTSVRVDGCSRKLHLRSGGSARQSAPCFLAGTRLRTSAGDVAVERLRAGDAVSVWRDGRFGTERVRWVGSRAVESGSGIVPVRIRAGAFAEGRPRADLLVTPDHCILVGDGLIPARMLVNGCSIIADDTLSNFDVHHVALHRHGILLAENLPAESLLDTGPDKDDWDKDDWDKDGHGRNGNTATDTPTGGIGAAACRGQGGACAPVSTDRHTVEPIWRRLQRRAASIGFGAPPPDPMLVDDPALRVLLDTGESLLPCVEEPHRLLFRIPYGAAPFALLSRSNRPSALIGPFVDDRRLLGVKIAALYYGEGLAGTAIPLRALPPVGWHDADGEGRWTDGAAALTLPAAASDTTMLTVIVAAMLRYNATPASGAAFAQRAA